MFVLNHPSWWDPMIGVLLSERFPGYEHFVPIDAEMLQKYGIFKRLGFYPLERDSVRGAFRFVKTTLNILSHDRHSVWITAQGKFCDVRQRPLNLEPGVGHIAARMKRGLIVPIAIEYAFWNESRPNAFIAVGQAMNVNDSQKLHAEQWLTKIESKLADTLDQLSVDVQSRDFKQFTLLILGRSGVGGIYDLWRRIKAWSMGQSFTASHESNQG